MLIYKLILSIISTINYNLLFVINIIKGRLVKHVFVDTSVASLLLWICSPNPTVLSPVWGSAAEYHLQLLNHQEYSVARLCLDQTFLLFSHWRHVAAMCMLYKVNLNSNHRLFSELACASVSLTDQSSGCSSSIRVEVSRCRMS